MLFIPKNAFTTLQRRSAPGDGIIHRAMASFPFSSFPQNISVCSRVQTAKSGLPGTCPEIYENPVIVPKVGKMFI